MMKPYENKELDMKTRMEDLKKRLEYYPFFATKDIHFELSNLCNYTYMHPQCPTSRMKDRRIMPLEQIESIAKKLGELGYDRTLSPYTYSEPLIDPRLYQVLDLLTKYVPKSRLAMVTNGFFLYDTTLDELVARGMKCISISCYLPEEHERIKKLAEIAKVKYPDIRFRVIKAYPLRKRMCDKFSIYEMNAPINTVEQSCQAPYRYMYITRYGDIAMCCNDWEPKVIFGSIEKDGFKKILTSERMMELHLNLINGNRKPYLLCSRCFRDK